MSTNPRQNCRLYALSVLLSTCFILAAGLSRARAAADYVWLEGEAPSSMTPADLKPTIAGWGHAEFLSGAKWLQVSVDPGNIEKQVPADGITLAYDFAAPHDGNYQIWNRIGYEYVRSAFDWRVDGGEWATIKPDQLTTDLMELQTWNEVAWLQMGQKTLPAGQHHLEIRLPRAKDEKGNWSKILYASDAIMIDSQPFYPNSKYQPGETRSDPMDTEAANKVFNLPAPTAAGRTSVKLEGAWQVTRNDENLPPPDIATPMKDLPAHPSWTGIPVPGNKNTLRPDLLFAHRLWYRTKVNVPDTLAGHSFYLTFPQNSLNTTVLVNGVYCGFNKNPFARFDIDVTPGIKTGVNEVWVGIRDAYYGYTNDPQDPMVLRRAFNLPIDWTSQGFQHLAYPVWGAFQSGILLTPTLTAAGSVYSSDVFVEPSVARKQLLAQVTVNNPTGKDEAGEVLCEALDEKTGAVEKALPVKPIMVAAGSSQTFPVVGAWADPKLWWPDQPNLYVLRTTVRLNGHPVDVSETPFGFREWTIDGINFKLNGIPFHGWHDSGPGGGDPKSWLAAYHQENQQMMRFWGTSWFGMTPDDSLSLFDRNGVVVRRQGMLDGEAIGYMAIEENPHLKQLYNSDIKMDLMNNWRDQMVAQVKGERNHPSIMIWSIENEWLFINCINLYGGLMDKFEDAVTATGNAVQAIDPTRPIMSDGGAATAKQTLPVHGNHYIDGPFQSYPELAYSPNVTGGGRGRWVWDMKRPRFVGEDFFMTGNHPEMSMFGGEEAFTGKAGTLHGTSVLARILTEGYRWAQYGAWDLYLGKDDMDGSQYVAYSPRAALCRQWDWTFAAGQKVKRTVGIFNDTHYPDPITFTWTLQLGGQKVATSTTVHQVAPGTREVFDVTLPMPAVTGRQDGKWFLALTAGGKQVFADTKDVSVLGDAKATVKTAADTPLSAKNLLVYDPFGTVGPFLTGRGMAFTPLQNLNTLPETGKVLIIGKDALDPQQSTSSGLAAYAATGRTVIVLEQKNPLKYQAFPAQMETGQNEGRTAFAEDLDHPVLKGLAQKDFFTWGAASVTKAAQLTSTGTPVSDDAEIVYRNAYAKPASGGKSLVECDNLLQDSALVEVPAGKGLLLLSQLLVGEKLSNNAVAQRLLMNLIDYGAQYKLTFRPVTVTAAANPQLDRTVDTIGLNYTKIEDPLAVISQPGNKIAVVNASPENLKVLANNLPKVNAYTAAGGWIVFNNLTPEGLEDYNKIVGFDHMIRKFGGNPSMTNAGARGIERVTLSAPRNPLTAGIATGDIVMYSSQAIFPWTAGNFTSPDEFSYVVDYDEVAPFAKSPWYAYGNITNGFLTADGWPLIINFPAKPDNSPTDIPLSLPKPQTLTELTWIGNTLYDPTTRINLIFDGDSASKLSLATQPTNSAQTFPITPPRKAKDIILQVADWQKLPDKNNTVGIDNIYLKAYRPPGFYKNVRPMLNIGAMMEYPKGPGGIVLCNLLFKDTEEVPENATKKRTIFSTLLRNLQAPFSGGKSIIAGANLNYSSINISKQANQFRGDRGWFGDKAFTLQDMPTGGHTFAGVPYNVYDFPTSPVPTVVMLGGQGVPNNVPMEVQGIPINQKADALFFLHTARIDRRRNNDEIKQNKQLEMFDYVVTYADGQTVKIPVYSEININDYKQQTVTPIPGAQIAWTRPYSGTDSTGVVYSMQWNNPHPDIAIKSIGMQYGPQAERTGIPALLALTAGK